MNAFNKVFQNPISTLVSDFVICSFGGGTNSTALLIECVKRGVRIDMILFLICRVTAMREMYDK